MEEQAEIPAIPVRMPECREDWLAIRQNYGKVTEELQAFRSFFEKMKSGTQRTCIFIGRCEGKGREDQVVTEDSKGEIVVAVHNQKMFGPLKRGELVLVGGDPVSGFAITGRCPIQPGVGSIMTLERSVKGDHSKVEVVASEGQKQIYWTSQDLADLINEGKVAPGAQLICSPSSHVAHEALPPVDGLSRFKYLLDEDAPDVIVERDIGAPPAAFFEVVEFFRMEMVNPALRRKYGARPLHTRLFTGPPGGGKTLTLKAIHKALYEITKEVTGVDEKTAGRRVLKMRSSQMLSMWLGESEKAFDRFFDEVVEIARKPVRVGKKERHLPTFVIMEEFDALARQRAGHAHDPVERIMTTLLQRLDPINEELSCGIICLIATTNEPGIIDRAALRRIGGKIDYFGMLTLSSFPKVLEKHIAKLPMASNNGDKQHELRAKAVEDISALLFEKDTKPVVEISMQGRSDVVRKYRRDFLSGALVDRAVQEAASIALKAEFDGSGDGLNAKQLASAFHNQISSVISQLSEGNAHKYVDIPDGEAVAKVKRV